MDLRIVSNCDKGRYYPIYGEFVLQESDGVNYIGNFISKKYHIFNLGFNERYEILSSERKYDFIRIINCDFDSKDLYFASCKELKEPGMMSLSIFKFSIITGKSDVIYSYDDEIQKYYDNKRIKIYVLNEGYFLIQTSYKRYDEYNNDLGFVDITLELYDIKEKSSRIIDIPMLNKNGIDKIIPIKGNTCIIKTGYSMIKDNRYDLIKPEDRPLEQIGFININQFISDLLLNKKEFYFERIEKFESNVTYPYIHVEDNIISYSRVNYSEHSETIVYYDIDTKSIQTFRNNEAFRRADLLETYNINGKVYTLKKIDDLNYELINLKDPKNKHTFSGCKIVNITHGFVITERTVPKSLFRKPYDAVEVYKDLSDEPVISERGHVIDVIYTNKDNLYIFTREDWYVKNKHS